MSALLPVSLLENWAQAVRAAAGQVQQAYDYAVAFHGQPAGPNRQMAARTWEGQMGVARGALMILRVLSPAEPQLEELWKQLNHVPLVALAGPDPVPAVEGQLTIEGVVQ